MLSKYLVGLNWTDFLIIAVVLRMCYIGLKTGIAVEAFKLFNLWLCTVVSFHIYTSPLSDYLNVKLPALPLDAGDVFVFVSLLVIITVLVRIIRESFFLLIKIEAHNTFDRWAGLLIGAFRGLWIASFGLFIMTISTVQYLETSAKTSLLGHRLLVLAPTIYKASHEGLISKFVAQNKVNEEVFKALNR